jgi:diaminopimelate decarboxylase
MIKHKELIKTYKSPLYIYDGTIIKRQYQKLKNAFSSISNFKINYAVKALSNIAILQLIKDLGANVDTVSIGEIKLALLAGFSPEQISFTPNGVPFAELEEAIAMGVHLTLDNLEQIYRYSEKYNKAIAIRIKPNVKAGGNEKIAVGHKNSKFGIPLEQIKEITSLIEAKKLTVDGLHLHTGSDILAVQSFLDAAEVLFETAHNFDNLKFLDFGSGFKVKYKPDDYETDIADLGKKLSNRFKEFNKNYKNDLTLIIEPGKFLVSESGQFLTTVSTIKNTNDKQFAFVDAGLNQLIRPMLYNAYHHIINLSNPKGKPENYDVVGYICETDTFASEQAIPKIKTGDILAFQNAGAYAFTMASNYNSRLRPAEVLCIDGRYQLIRKRETFEDLIRNQVY